MHQGHKIWNEQNVGCKSDLAEEQGKRIGALAVRRSEVHTRHGLENAAYVQEARASRARLVVLY